MLHYPGDEDTIAALATATGRSGIAVVKVSGPESISLVNRIFKSPQNPEDHDRRMIYGHIMDNGEFIDDVLVCLMKGPQSYTGDDVVEIQTHGGSASAGITIGLLTDLGARIAEPGEFTKRAFLNGKIDLVQAEAVMEIVAAEGREYLKQAEHLMDGTFSARIEGILEKLRTSASLLELNIDFTDHGVEEIHPDELTRSLKSTIDTISSLIATYGTARRIKEGVRVVIAGKVNSGKSSLFNALLGKNRAIVNSTPGTTRDWIEEKIDLDGIPVNLIDTAGIRETPDDIEREGVEKAGNLIKNADIVLNLIEPAELPDNNHNSAPDANQHIFIVSKADLYDKPAKSDHLFVSSQTGEGLSGLNTLLSERARSLTGYSTIDTMVLIDRHRRELEKAKTALDHAHNNIGSWSEEIISMDIAKAQKHIENILGKQIDIDILNEIFSHFCIGK